MSPPIFVPPYLAPTSAPPLEGSDLEDFMHDVITGITGLANEVVLPRWQPEPPDIPQAATAWAAFGFMPSRETTLFPPVVHDGNANGGIGADTVQQQEQLEMRVSFYDLGAGGQADKYCALFRDGLYVPQNREAMLSEGIVLVATGAATPSPVLVKERWLYRVDVSVTLRRQIDRTYGVPNIESAQGTLYGETSNDDVIVSPLNVEPPP